MPARSAGGSEVITGLARAIGLCAGNRKCDGGLRLRHRRRGSGRLRAGPRLSEDPGNQVLLLEYGGRDANPLLYVQDGFYFTLRGGGRSGSR
jgi:hypothetical protein